MQERPHSYKPRPKFFGTGGTFFGLELEVEAPDYQAKQSGLEAEANPNWCYAKHDGSLGANGWELVTHPVSMNFWLSRGDVQNYRDIPVGTVLTREHKGTTHSVTALAGGRFEWEGQTYKSIGLASKAISGGWATDGYKFFGLKTGQDNPTAAFFRLVANLSRLGYTSHDGGRCGFHIHISRTAFSDAGDLRNAAFYRFKVLVNGLLFRKLSQRESFSYCEQSPVDPENFWERGYSRYQAVNITDATVEVRIFRGNLREARLRKNIEAVIAALEFAREVDSYAVPTDAEFAAFVRARAERFPNLAAYINHLDGTKEGEESCA